MSSPRNQHVRTATMLSKVPEVTIFFWIIKILATTIGETAADYLNETLGWGLTTTTYVMSAALAIILVFQFRARQYIPTIYWLAVVALSIVGTLVTDNLVENYNVALRTTTVVASCSGQTTCSTRSSATDTIRPMPRTCRTTTAGRSYG